MMQKMKNKKYTDKPKDGRTNTKNPLKTVSKSYEFVNKTKWKTSNKSDVKRYDVSIGEQ